MQHMIISFTAPKSFLIKQEASAFEYNTCKLKISDDFNFGQ